MPERRLRKVDGETRAPDFSWRHSILAGRPIEQLAFFGSANARDFISALLPRIASLFLLVGLLWGRRVVGLEGIHDVEKACDHHDAK